MFINVTYDSSVTNAPAGFKACINAVCQYYDSLFTNNVTVNIDVGYGTIDGNSLGADSLGESEGNDSAASPVSYAQLRSALVASGAPGSQALPTTAPSGLFLSITPAEEKALGLFTGSGTPLDGWAGFSSTASFDYDPTNSKPVPAGQYDFFAVVEHEFSEVMGRVSGLGSLFSLYYSPMDLYRYYAPGSLQTFGFGTGYYSINGGATALDTWNNYLLNSSGDLGDWAASAGNDAYLASSNPGQLNTVTATDILLMRSLGWTTAGNSVTIPTYGMTAVNAAGAAITSINAGSTVTFELATGNVAAGTVLDYSITGTASYEVVGPLTGMVTVGSTGSAAVTVGVIAFEPLFGTTDLTLSLTSGGPASATIAVNDVVLTVDQAISDFGAGLIRQAAVVDAAANVASQLDELEFLLVGNWISSISLTDSGVPTLSVSAGQLTSDAIALNKIEAVYSLSVPGVSASVAEFVVAQDALYRQTSSGGGISGIGLDYAGNVVGQDSVIGFQSAALSGPFNTVVLDGPRSQYALQVDATGKTVIEDTVAHSMVTITGDTYLIYNGGATSNGVYSGMDFVLSGNSQLVAELYSAALGRVPDLAGLEYWIGSLSTGSTLEGIANSFLSSGEFTSLYGNVAAITDATFLAQLYQNILGRAADPSGLAYWESQLATGAVNRAQALIAFAGSQENLQKISAANGGWLIDTATGGYADSSLLLPATTVLTQGIATGYVNTALIDPTTVSASGTSVGGWEIWSTANLTETNGLTDTVAVTQSNLTVVLSPNINAATAESAGITGTDISGASNGGSLIAIKYGSVTLSGAGNAVTIADTAGGNIVNGLPGVTIGNFAAGDTLHLAGSNTANTTVTIVTPTAAAPLSGASGAAQTSLGYVVELGNVGTGSTAAVAAAANQLVTPENGQPLSLVLVGQAGTDTVLYSWSSSTGGTIDTGHFYAGVKLAGVNAAALVAAEFA